jgi:hypothetical protein
MQRSSRGLFQFPIPTYEWTAWGNAESPSVKLARRRAEIRTHNLENSKQEY